ncbi:MAG: hypothetical protein M3132_08990 [Actinomycetia bacterium]|nr:hypothetical protein [Actinomycetes bacterium]
MSKDTKQVQPRNKPRWRFVLTIVLTVIFGLSLIAANHAAWLVTTALDTDAFVGALAPLPSDPDVARALGQGVADTIVESVEVGQSIADALPDGLQFIAIGVTESLRDLITDIATKIVQSDVFVAIWETALRIAHGAAIRFAEGFSGDVVTTDGDAVILDLTSIYEPIAEQLQSLGFDALDGATPDLTIELFEIEGQGLVQSIVRIVTSIRWFAIGLTIILAIGVFITSVDRRRTAVWVGSSMVVAMLVSLIDIRLLKSAATDGITDTVSLAGATAALDITFSRFVVQSWIMLVFGTLIALGAWLMGDSERAISIRSTVTGESGGEEPTAVALFVTSNRRILEWGVSITVAILLLIAPLPPTGIVILVIAAVIAFIGAVEFIAATTPLGASSAEFDSDVSV